MNFKHGARWCLRISNLRKRDCLRLLGNRFVKLVSLIRSDNSEPWYAKSWHVSMAALVFVIVSSKFDSPLN